MQKLATSIYCSIINESVWYINDINDSITMYLYTHKRENHHCTLKWGEKDGIRMPNTHLLLTSSMQRINFTVIVCTCCEHLHRWTFLVFFPSHVILWSFTFVHVWWYFQHNFVSFGVRTAQIGEIRFYFFPSLDISESSFYNLRTHLNNLQFGWNFRYLLN